MMKKTETNIILKGIPYPYGLIKCVLAGKAHHKIIADKNKYIPINVKQGLAYIYLYEERELVEEHTLCDYINELATLKDVEKAFSKETNS